MASLLWAVGKREAALELERLWDSLAGQHGFSLHCAYPISLFGRQEDGTSFLEVCNRHSEVMTAEGHSGSMLESLETAAYRVVHEALTCAHRHPGGPMVPFILDLGNSFDRQNVGVAAILPMAPAPSEAA